jgi:hypothetical protein
LVPCTSGVASHEIGALADRSARSGGIFAVRSWCAPHRSGRFGRDAREFIA